MAMLAERRRKQKWTLNPRGKYWTDDSNKIGQKMLEKMGWTSGKGLGVNEQGNPEPCRIPYKSNTTGIGYDKNPEAWIEHHDKFEDFLQQLQENLDQDMVQKLENKNDLSKQSTELKSKNPARVYCQKFVRGKDLATYKSKDLANIFGRKELTDIEASVEKNNSTYEEEAVDTKNNKYGIVTINGGSMTDYFKSKLNGKPTCDKSLASNMTDNETTDSQNGNERVGFGFAPKIDKTSTKCEVSKDSDERSNYAFDNPCLGWNSPVDSTFNTDGTTKKSGEKRKNGFQNAGLHLDETNRHDVRKKLKAEITDSGCKNAFTNSALNLDTESEGNCNGKEFEISRSEFGLENCGLDLTDEKSDKKRVTFSDHIMMYEYNIDSSKKKKKEQTKLDKFEVENKRHKKKRKHESIATPVSDGCINEALDIETFCDEINDNELNEHRSKRIKKRKICKISRLETIQESPEQEKEINDMKTEPEVITLENEKTDIVDQKSKKKKKVKVEEIIEEPNIKIEKTNRNKKLKRDKNKEGEILTSKKCKKKKDKCNKENCKAKFKSTVQTEISVDKINIDILEKPNMKQQQIDHSAEIEDKNTTGIETLPVVTLEAQDIKRKKKKKSIDTEDCLKNEMSRVRNVDREISDKENADKSQDPQVTQKLGRKDKKRKKSKDMNVSDIGDSSCNIEVADVNTTKEEKIEKAEFVDTSSKRNKIIDAIDGIIHSQSSVKARVSKKMLMTLFPQ
ncbi:hypothetical protein DMN91_003140 [Ooceraea biroi]|uniref:PIN2/TERF1-interacting telomerase inhibitor n=1 Tax=Ooceraea biroi TaxID=2015173 RepID=A0A026WKL6_OOCBI|nr:uncharacterized protein LOC105278080 [Ooceraea biroi]EZA56592.1 PIN2/TERF1-interacting telomerase inhibitor [Ooceraea biroi]RLU25048.1 hypothetical protein DMN91_003140 [Ooceraea biroi]